MRRLLTTTIIVCAVSGSAFAQTPVFRPIDPSMHNNSNAKLVTPAIDTTTSTPATPLPRAHDGEIIQSEGGGAIPPLPLKMTTQNGISYLSGGVGEEEEAQLKGQQDQYNLQLMITGLKGEYLSDLVATIKNAKGDTLVTINDAGPYLYLKLAPDTYTVEVVAPSGNGKKFSLKLPATGAVKTQIRF